MDAINGMANGIGGPWARAGGVKPPQSATERPGEGKDGLKLRRHGELVNLTPTLTPVSTTCPQIPDVRSLTPSSSLNGAAGTDARSRTAAEREVLDAVEAFEAIFLRYLASAMNRTLSGADEGSQPGGKYYQGLIDTQMGDMLARNNGLGLGEALLRQLAIAPEGSKPEGNRPEGYNDDS